MAKEEFKKNHSRKRQAVQSGGAGGVWSLGFVGALVYFLHFHSGTFWLVLMALFKAVLWPAYLVYYLLHFMRI